VMTDGVIRAINVGIVNATRWNGTAKIKGT
jgi:hypothetical protein